MPKQLPSVLIRLILSFVPKYYCPGCGLIFKHGGDWDWHVLPPRICETLGDRYFYFLDYWHPGVRRSRRLAGKRPWRLITQPKVRRQLGDHYGDSHYSPSY